MLDGTEPIRLSEAKVLARCLNKVDEALNKARQMYETGLVNVSIEDQAGHKIDGDELLACIMGQKTITNDLQAK